MYGAINTDQFMAKAIAEFYGMRITKNEPWEATLCFVMSQFNNIKRIRRIMLNLINKIWRGLWRGRACVSHPRGSCFS